MNEAETILVVEDDPTLLQVLRDNLEFLGYAVVTASDGRRALDAAEHANIDLVILDVMLPRINGYEVCQRLRTGGYDVPIIMLTARDEEIDAVRGLEIGADDYVTKPFRLNELLARVKAFLRRQSKDRADESYAFGDCVLEVGPRRLLRAGHEVDLTPKEFDMLLAFNREPGRALTRRDLLRRVWGNSVVVTQRSVDRCVTTLRSKVEPEPGRPVFIKTVRDIGYRFDAAP